MAIFKTGGNFKSNTGHFYVNFEYKMHLNFGGNFSKKKVRLIVRKIRYPRISLAIINPEQCRVYVASLQSMVPVNLN